MVDINCCSCTKTEVFKTKEDCKDSLDRCREMRLLQQDYLKKMINDLKDTIFELRAVMDALNQKQRYMFTGLIVILSVLLTGGQGSLLKLISLIEGLVK